MKTRELLWLCTIVGEACGTLPHWLVPLNSIVI